MGDDVRDTGLPPTGPPAEGDVADTDAAQGTEGPSATTDAGPALAPPPPPPPTTAELRAAGLDARGTRRVLLLGILGTPLAVTIVGALVCTALGTAQRPLLVVGTWLLPSAAFLLFGVLAVLALAVPPPERFGSAVTALLVVSAVGVVLNAFGQLADDAWTYDAPPAGAGAAATLVGSLLALLPVVVMTVVLLRRRILGWVAVVVTVVVSVVLGLITLPAWMPDVLAGSDYSSSPDVLTCETDEEAALRNVIAELPWAVDGTSDLEALGDSEVCQIGPVEVHASVSSVEKTLGTSLVAAGLKGVEVQSTTSPENPDGSEYDGLVTASTPKGVHVTVGYEADPTGTPDDPLVMLWLTSP